MNTQLALLTALLVKHFLADWPWQAHAVAQDKAHPDARVWAPAMGAHCMVHMMCTAAVLLVAISVDAPIRMHGNALVGVLWAEFAAHFIIDRIKADKRLGGRWPLSNPRFWTALGADQLAHHLTYVAMVVWLVRS